MTPESAAKIRDATLKCGELLTSSLKDVQDAESAKDFIEYREAVSKVMLALLDEVLNPLFSKFPDLKPPNFR